MGPTSKKSQRIEVFALCALLFVAIPAPAQGVGGYPGAIERAMRCVHAAMTDGLLPVGAMPEQIAEAALARCFDEIEGAAAVAVAGSPALATRLGAIRVALRRELYEYALQVTARARADADSGYAAETLVSPVHRSQEGDAALLATSRAPDS